MNTNKKKDRSRLILAHCFNMDARAASQTITDRLPYLIRQGVKPIAIGAPKNLVLDIYGMVIDNASRNCLELNSVGEMINEHGRLEYSSTTGKSGRQQVIEEMQNTDVLLLMHGRGDVCEEYIPSKVYEYIQTGRPILGLVAPDSELADILMDQGHLVVDGDDEEAIKLAVISLMTRFSTEGLSSSTLQSPFTVKKAVEKLLDIVQQLGQSPQSVNLKQIGK